MRARGTGTVRKSGQIWEAFTPASGSGHGQRIGSFQFRFQAERALEKWLTENMSKSVDPQLSVG